jgi:hypothetical protein
MAKPKTPFSNLIKPTDAQLADMQRGHPFKNCKQCGLPIVASRIVCPECERLTEIGFGPVPRKCYPLPGQDTQPVQSYPNDKHTGYHDTISHRKIDPTRERY